MNKQIFTTDQQPMNRALLLEVLSVQTYSYEEEMMDDYLEKKLSSMAGVRWQRDAYGNLYAWKGNAVLYPCLVSHKDTVHELLHKFEVRPVKERDGDWLQGWNPLANAQAGIGGDDKVGVFLCLELLERLPAVKLAFFSNEEVGCLGSSKADLSFFEDCVFVLQCDRRGNSDFVNTIGGMQLYPQSFSRRIGSLLSAHGYSEHAGGLTDIYTLKRRGLTVPVANMSCGYYDPHSRYETVCVDDVANCLDLLLAIANEFWADASIACNQDRRNLPIMYQ